MLLKWILRILSWISLLLIKCSYPFSCNPSQSDSSTSVSQGLSSTYLYILFIRPWEWSWTSRLPGSALATSSSPLSHSAFCSYYLALWLQRPSPFPSCKYWINLHDQKLLAFAAAVLYKVALIYQVCGLQAVSSLHSRHTKARGSCRSQFFAFNIGSKCLYF